MNFLDAEFVQEFIRMANDGWEQGWHERNGGNLSYRVKPEEVELIKENFKAKEWQPIGTSVPNLAGEFFLVTGSGKYFRNVIIKPEDSICMIELDEKGENYRIVWGLVNGGRPTSELPSHLMNLEVKKLQNPNYRVVYHAHTTNIIALTFVLPLEDKVFTRELWEMATECPVVFPDGVGVVPWMVPGGREIAVATSELMKKYDLAIWAHHGMFAAGEDFDLTFGLMHTAEKSAEILVKMLSMRPDKLQTITPDNFRDLAKAILSIGAVKGFEIGAGFGAATATGLTNNDAFCMENGHISKRTNYSGGTLGGMSDGSLLFFRAAVKPTPSIAATQQTVNKDGKEIEISIKGRHDPIIVPRAVVVVEAMTAITILDALLSNMTARLDRIIDFYRQ